MKLETESLKTSAIGICPKCSADTTTPAPTVPALSLNGLKSEDGNILLVAEKTQTVNEDIIIVLIYGRGQQNRQQLLYIR